MAMGNPANDLFGSKPNLAKGYWRGYVVSRDDPEKRQRVKIRIPELHRGISDDELPWSMPVSSGEAHAGGGVGSVNVPAKGALVEGYFEEDDPHNFRFHGSPPVDSVNKQNELLNEDYPYTTGHVDEAGNKFSTNRLRKEILIQHASGAFIFFDGAGNISIAGKGKATVSGNSGVDIVSGGRTNIHSAERLDVKAPPISLNGAGSGMSATPTATRATPSIPSSAGKTSL